MACNTKPPADKRSEHMAKRKAQGLTHREVADEFGVSKSTSHRRVNMVKDGLSSRKSARD